MADPFAINPDEASPAIPQETPQQPTPEEEDVRQTGQNWNVLGVDYSEVDDLERTEVEAQSKSDRKAGRLISKAMRKAPRRLAKRQRVRKRFGYDAAIDAYAGDEMGLTPEAAFRNTVNFLIGDDLAVTGLEWNENNFTWNMENLKQTWSDEPVWRNAMRVASLGLNFIPVAGAINKSMKFGKIGKLLPAKSFKFIDPVDGAQSFRWFERFSDEASEAAFLTQQGFLEVGATAKAAKSARKAMASRQRANKIDAINKAIAKDESHFQWAGESIKIGPVDKAKANFNRSFANSYWAASNNTAIGFHKAFTASLDKFYKVEDFGKHFSSLTPDLLNPVNQKAIHKFMQSGDKVHLSKMNQDSVTQLDNLMASYKNHQDEWFEMGAGFSDEIPEHLQAHIPLQRPGTPGPDMGQKTISVVHNPATKAGRKPAPTKLSIVKVPKMGSPTLKQRGTREVDEILNKIDNGEVISDLQNHSLPNHMLDRVLLHNFKFMRDAINEMPGLAINASAMTKVGKIAQKNYINLNAIPFDGKDTLRRILKKGNSSKLDANGDLPWVPKGFFQEWMGDAGMMEQAFDSAGLLQGMVAVHKTAKTALNPATHGTNVFGNMIMQNWAGYNPISPHNIKVGTKLTHGFKKYSKALRTEKAAAEKAGREWNKQTAIDTIDDVIEVTNSEGRVTQFNLRDLLNDTDFTKLVEESAFETVEGLARLEDIYKGMAKHKTSAKILNSIIVAKNSQGIRQGIDMASEAYLLEDMIPKAQMYVQNIAEGMSKDVALSEVARSLPMYNTVGPAIKSARKLALPWITFPSEMTRIMKNQIMDNPMRIMPWLNMTNQIQATGYLTGQVEGFEAAQETEKNLPAFAKTPSTVVGSENFTDVLQAAPAGAALGGAIGMKFGRPGVGAAAGVAIGVGAALLNNSHFNSERETADEMRGAVLRWLPHTSVMLGNNAPELMNQMTGKDIGQAIKGGNVAQLIAAAMPGRDMQTTASILPVEPLAILDPLISMMTGKNAMGQEIKATDPGAKLTKTMAGLVGFMAPPLVQKYGYKQTSPDEAPPVVGRGGAGILGAAAGAALGAARGGVPGAVVGGVVGGVLGGSANVSKLSLDVGRTVDPRTMREADTFADFFLNNMGAVKSYSANPENRAANTKMNDRAIQNQRTALKKQASYYFVNHREEEATQYLHKVQTTFERQHPLDPDIAEDKFSEWMESFIDGVGESPMWGGLSKEEMKAEMKRTRKRLGSLRSQSLREWMQWLQEVRRKK